MCKIAFDYLGLNYKEHIIFNKNFYRPNENYPVVGNIDKAKNILGWKAKMTFSQLIHYMIDFEIEHIKKGTNLKYENIQIYYSSLIKEIGLIRLEKGKSVKDILEIDGISLWDVFSSELAWRHLTTAFSKKRETNLKIYLKSVIIKVRNFFDIFIF